MKSQNQNIDKLNDLLRGEIAAQENYDQVIPKVRSEHPEAAATLLECQSSHRRRAEQLETYIRQNGGDPVRTAGTWGGFAKAFQGAAKVFGERSAVSALEEGEDHGLRDYRRKIDELQGEHRSFVERLMPEQQRTHDAVSSLQSRI